MKNYLKFLDHLTGNLNRYFENQAPYIKCQKGCAKCCSNGDYPFSEMEVRLLKVGYSALDSDTKEIIEANIRDIAWNKKNNTEPKFTYQCPFLINNMCSVYEYRGIICRTFGLISLKKDSKMQIPFCVDEGLNYSNVMDEKTRMLSTEKMQALGIEQEPIAYNVHYSFLTSEKIEHAFDFQYGEKGPLIDLLAKDKTFKQFMIF